MRIEEAIDTTLKASAELTAIVGAKVYWGEAPQKTPAPYLVHFDVSDPPIPDVPFRRPRWQFSAFAESATVAKEAARVVRELFCRYVGVMAGGVAVRQGAEISTETTRDPSGLWHSAVDIYFIHREGN